MSSNGGMPAYRHRIELVRSGAGEALVERWAAARFDPAPVAWRLVYGKVRPQRSAWAHLVYQAEDGTTVAVRLLEQASSSPSAGAELVDSGELGVAELLPCATDPALPGLGWVLATLAGARVVRYHPGNRCIVHGGRGAGERYVKVFHKEVDDQREARERWQAARSGALSFAVAEPHGWDDRSRSSWYGPVRGTPVVAEIRGAAPLDLVRRIGAALGELAVAPLHPAVTADDAHQLERTGRSLRRAAAALPSIGARLDRVAEHLTREHARLLPRPLVPIHGAAHLGQWLVDETGRLGLVDFDRFARGEPEFDLATFLVEAEASASALPMDRLRSAAVEGFCGAAGSVDDERLDLYLLHKRLGRVVRATTGLRSDGHERAARGLVEVERQLGVSE